MLKAKVAVELDDIIKKRIDKLGVVRKRLKKLLKEEETLKILLKPLGIGTHKGYAWYAEITPGTWTGLDVKVVKANLPAVWDEYKIETPYLEISVKPRV